MNILNIKKNLAIMNVKDFAKSQMQNACEYLKNQNPKYDWVGIYVLEHGKLKLEAFVGEKTEHVEINSVGDSCAHKIQREGNR